MEIITELLKRFPGRFATELGLDLKSSEGRQQWFLAAVLFGARISGTLAARTFRTFMAAGVHSLEAILAQGWDNLVVLLDRGGYTRYDFKTATKLLKSMESLQERYQGSLERLHEAAEDEEDLKLRLMGLAPGIGPSTVNIFLRELRGTWAKADPVLSPLAQAAAEHSGLLPLGLHPREALQELQRHWRAQPAAGFDFADLEAALVRLGLELRRGSKFKAGS
ncbi:MAG: hypothetical protein M1438_03500 [Deltaproteobacteria bacterium]|nr:hypothetical protein [Deltaproteobacteria bacterium]